MIKVEDYKKEILFIFFSQKAFIFKVTLIIFIGSVLIALFWPPTYAAYGSFLLKGKELQKNPTAIEGIEFRQTGLKKEDLASEVEMLVAHETIDKALKKLNEKHPGKGYDSLSVDSVRGKLKTEILPASNVIKVSYFAKQPDFAKALLEVVMAEYIRARLAVLNNTKAKGFFSGQVEQYEEELVKKENELHKLVSTTKVSNPEKQIEGNILLLKDLETNLNLLNNDIIGKKQLIKHLQKSLGSREPQTFSFIENPSLNHLSLSLIDNYSESSKILKNYRSDSEEYKSSQRQLENLYKLMRKEVSQYKRAQQSELDILERQRKEVQGRIDTLNSDNVILHKQIMDTNKILRESGILTSTLETFAQRREEASANAIESDANLFYSVNIIDQAYASADPVYPKKVMTIVLGLIVGFITGCSLGFSRSYLDHTFKSVLDVDRYLAQPVLFSIDDYSRKA